MKFSKGFYKDLEAVIAETEKLTAVFLPSQGGKLVSLVCRKNGKDYLAQRDEAIYRRLGPDTQYTAAECSAYDDMFPTIDPWEIPDGPLKGARYLDHGEVCRLPHDFTIGEDSVHTFVRSNELPFTFERVISENTRGGLRIDLTATNTGDCDFDYIWASHFMARAVEGGRIISPFPYGSPVEMVFSSNHSKYGERGAKVSYPYGADGVTRIDTSNAHLKDADEWKFYMSTAFPEGFYGYNYPDDGTRLMLRFDPLKVPYGGAWMNDGHGELSCFYNAAIEICTGTFDRPDSARERNQYSVLKANSSEKWYLEIDIE